MIELNVITPHLQGQMEDYELLIHLNMKHNDIFGIIGQLIFQ